MAEKDGKRSKMADYDYKKTEEYKFQKRAIEKYSKLSTEEKFRRNVELGIYTEDGELTKRYGGDAPNPEEKAAE